MDLCLQFGYGMMELSRELVREWSGGTTILSPRDLDAEQLVKFGEDLRDLGGAVLLDPQFYLPRADHHRLISHSYWPNDYDTAGFDAGGRKTMMDILAGLNRSLATRYFVVPGLRADVVNEDWLACQAEMFSAAREATDLPLMATVCLSGDAVRSSDQINLVMEQAEENPAHAYYLVFEKPGLAYLVNDPIWVANCLDLVAGLKLLGAYVMVGYANHQQTVLGCAAADAIASGTWMNVRSFPPDKFRSEDEAEKKRRTVWFYLPQALSEYTVPFLDIGFRLGMRESFVPDPWTSYAAPLFQVTQPSSIGWGEPEAFRHYLISLGLQVRAIPTTGFDDAVTHHRLVLDRAETDLRSLIQAGIRCPQRDFSDAIAANRAALAVLEKTHGPRLRRGWSGLSRA